MQYVGIFDDVFLLVFFQFVLKWLFLRLEVEGNLALIINNHMIEYKL